MKINLQNLFDELTHTADIPVKVIKCYCFTFALVWSVDFSAVYYYVYTNKVWEAGCFMTAPYIYVHHIFALKCLKSLEYDFSSWCLYTEAVSQVSGAVRGSEDPA